MGLSFFNHQDLSYSAAAPVIMIGSNQPGLERSASLIEGAELRIADTVAVPAARKRLARQAAASAVWLELDGEFGPAAQDLLDDLNWEVADARYAAIVSTTSALIDPLVARLDERRIEFIVDADDRQRAAAIASALSSARRASQGVGYRGG